MFDWLRRFIMYFRPPMEGIGKFFRRPRVAEPARHRTAERLLTSTDGPGDSGTAQGKQGGAVDDGMPTVDRAPTGRPDEPTSGELARGTDSPRPPADPIEQLDPTFVPRDPPPAESRSDSEPPGAQPIDAADPSLEIDGSATKQKPNRKTRRRIDALERARLKLDRWVEPKGERPAPTPRTKKEPTAEPAAATTRRDPDDDEGPNDPGEAMIVDPIDGQDVLFLERELYGTFHFRDTILDQLELYWIYLRRMKATDIDAYETYRRLGATILPPFAWFMHDGPQPDDREEHKKQQVKKELSAWWKVNRPGFGCVSYGITSRVEAYEINPPEWRRDKDRSSKDYAKKIWNVWVPKFLYFTKYAHPPSTIQPTTNGDVYSCTVWWDRPNDKAWQAKYKSKGGTPQTFPIYISHDGSDVHLLKRRETFRAEPKNIQNRSYRNGKKGRKKPHAGDAMRVYNTWHYSKEFVNWANDYETDVDVFLCNLFLNAARAFEFSGYGMTRVEVCNGDLTAVFSVDPRRMAYFFKDRDITLTKSGKRERIFHMVRPHTRTLPNGTVQHVPFTFRGQPEFEWAGYHVKITIPGRDHLMLTEFDLGVDDSEWHVDSKDKSDNLDMAQIADLLHGYIDDGFGAIGPGTRRNDDDKKN